MYFFQPLPAEKAENPVYCGNSLTPPSFKKGGRKLFIQQLCQTAYTGNKNGEENSSPFYWLKNLFIVKIAGKTAVTISPNANPKVNPKTPAQISAAILTDTALCTAEKNFTPEEIINPKYSDGETITAVIIPVTIRNTDDFRKKSLSRTENIIIHPAVVSIGIKYLLTRIYLKRVSALLSLTGPPVSPLFSARFFLISALLRQRYTSAPIKMSVFNGRHIFRCYGTNTLYKIYKSCPEAGHSIPL